MVKFAGPEAIGSIYPQISGCLFKTDDRECKIFYNVAFASLRPVCGFGRRKNGENKKGNCSTLRYLWASQKRRLSLVRWPVISCTTNNGQRTTNNEQ